MVLHRFSTQLVQAWVVPSFLHRLSLQLRVAQASVPLLVLATLASPWAGVVWLGDARVLRLGCLFLLLPSVVFLHRPVAFVPIMPHPGHLKEPVDVWLLGRHFPPLAQQHWLGLAQEHFRTRLYDTPTLSLGKVCLIESVRTTDL